MVQYFICGATAKHPLHVRKLVCVRGLVYILMFTTDFEFIYMIIFTNLN